MNKSVTAIFAMVCLSTLSAWTGQWTYDSASGLLSHDTPGWVLAASLNGTNLSVTGVSQTPASPSALPLNDPVPGYALVSIGDSAFFDCYNLTTVTIPDSVTSIGAEAFFYCGNLTTVTIPNSVTSIGDESFYGCYSLGTVSLGNGVTTIGGSAFEACEALTGLVLPAGIRSLGFGMLANCASLTAVTFEGAYPAQVPAVLYGWDGNSGVTTSYLYAAHTAS